MFPNLVMLTWERLNHQAMDYPSLAPLRAEQMGPQVSAAFDPLAEPQKTGRRPGHYQPGIGKEQPK